MENEPPQKKARFFKEKPEDVEPPVALKDIIVDTNRAVRITKEEPEWDYEPKKVLEEIPAIKPEEVKEEDSLAFSQDTFECFVGEKCDPKTFQRLREAAGDDMTRAVNIWFDGSWKDVVPSPVKREVSAKEKPLKPLTLNSFATPRDTPEAKLERKRSDGYGSGSQGSPYIPKSTFRLNSQPRGRMPEYKYIGAFGTEGWTTRSGLNVIQSGEKVIIERHKILPPQPPPQKVTKNKDQKKIAPMPVKPKANSAAGKRIDVIVRLKNSRGEEIGRLAKETADWVSTLVDQRICKFEAICVYAPERVKTNDTIFLQVRCSLLRAAFDENRFKIPDNRETGMFLEKESSEEKELRLKQVALVKLFDQTNLLPSRTNETTARHKRQGLLQAAEVAEQFEKDHAKDKKDKPTSGSSTPATQTEDEPEDGKELEQDQLDALYKKAQTFDFNAPEAEPAETFAMDLRPYQKQALHWMIAKEKDEKVEGAEEAMHPLWEEYKWPAKDFDDKDVPIVEGIESFYVNPYSGEMSLHFPQQKQHCLGGILADEMGLGKTIEMMSLVHTHKSDVQQRLEQEKPASSKSRVSLPRLHATPTVERAPVTTLVVAPMSLLSQWHSEAEAASKEGTLKAIVYYGADKSADLQTLCSEDNAAFAPNVIITSYGVVLSEFNRIAEKSGGDRAAFGGLFSLKFFRVILDEAHHIKNRQSKTAKACYEIEAEHRWVLTGTPIVNRLEDLFSLVRFLRVEPWSNFSFWKTFITVPFESKDFMRALDVVQTVLQPLVLRRTKDMKMPNGDALVALPKKTVEIVDIELSEKEREVYDHIFWRAKRTFAENVEKGTVMKSYTSIFAQILRLRQSCCHPTLVRNQTIVADELEAEELKNAKSGLEDDMDLQTLIQKFTADAEEGADVSAKFGAHALAQIRDESEHECPLCYEEPMIEQVVTACWHSACKKCLLDYITHQQERGEIPKCFNCREDLDMENIFEVIKTNEIDLATGKLKIMLQRISSNSAKIEKLMEQLKALRREAPGTKSVVFSQFTSFLSLISPALDKADMPFLRLDGTMSQKNRAAVLEEFKTSKKGIVLLLSLRAGGVGLNLTMAKRVWMMDPWWSFAVEAQAIDRVHRMGQDEEVKVYRFVVKNSVEERMLKVQDRKKFIASSLGMMSDEEKKMQRIEDIKELLS